MTKTEKVIDKVMFGDEITPSDVSSMTKKDFVIILNTISDALFKANDERINAVENQKSLTRYIDVLTSRLENTVKSIRKEACEIVKEFNQ